MNKLLAIALAVAASSAHAHQFNCSIPQEVMFQRLANIARTGPAGQALAPTLLAQYINQCQGAQLAVPSVELPQTDRATSVAPQMQSPQMVTYSPLPAATLQPPSQPASAIQPYVPQPRVTPSGTV